MENHEIGDTFASGGQDSAEKQDVSPTPADPDIQHGIAQSDQQVDVGPSTAPADDSGDPNLNVSAQPVPIPSILVVGSQTFSVLPGGGFAIAHSTIQANGPAVTVQGVPWSLDRGQLIAGSSTLTLATGNTNGVLTAAGKTFTPLGHDRAIVEGHTLSINGPPTSISGTALSLASSGLVVGSEFFAFPTPAAGSLPETKAAVTFAGQKFTPLGGGSVAVGGNTLFRNGPAATISGTVVSVASSLLVVGSQTFALPTPGPSVLPNGVIIDGTTLGAGNSALTVSGTSYSLTSGSSGGYTLIYGSGQSSTTIRAKAGESLFLNAEGQVVVGSVTLPQTGSESIDLASVIMHGFGPINEAGTASVNGTDVETGIKDLNATASNNVAFTGEASTINIQNNLVICFACGVWVFLLWQNTGVWL